MRSGRWLGPLHERERKSHEKFIATSYREKRAKGM